MKIKINAAQAPKYPPLETLEFETDCGARVKIASRDGDGIGPWIVTVEKSTELCTHCIAEIGTAFSALVTYVYGDEYSSDMAKVSSQVTSSLTNTCGPPDHD